MAGGLSLSAVMLWWLGCSALTMLYCSGAGEHLARGVFIAVAVFLTCYLVCFALARRAGGQTEATVGAAGLVGELAFLMFYLPVARAIYWY
jgi:cobalamin synthase